MRGKNPLHQPIKPVVALSIVLLGTVLGVGTGIAYWNGADNLLPGNRRGGVFEKLVLVRLQIETNDIGNRQRDMAARPIAVPLQTDQPIQPPVPYLKPPEEDRTPPPPPASLSPVFREGLSERLNALLEQGGIPIKEMPVSEANSGSSVPRQGMANGLLTLRIITAKTGKDEKTGEETATFRLIMELSRGVYMTRQSAQPVFLTVFRRTEGPIRVVADDLEAAVAYEAERMLLRDIVTPFLDENPDSRKRP